MSPSGPVVSDTVITFRFDDPEHHRDGVRLEVDWPVAGPTLDFAADDDGWSLTIPRPEATRIEYQFSLRDGEKYEWTTDPANPARVPNPFGEKSELLLPGYAAPSWLATEAAGELEQIDIPAGELQAPVPVHLWAAPGLAPDAPAPLLVVHDGSDMADRGSLLRWATVASGELPFRMALLDPAPGLRDDWYGADDIYSDHLAGELLPALTERVPTTSVIALGASLGAVAMAYLQYRHPASVQALALQSGSFFTPELDPQEVGYRHFERLCTVSAALGAERHSPLPPVLMTCGAIEENLANNRALAAALTEQGAQVSLVVTPDAHTMIGWRDAWQHGLLELIGRAEQR